MKTLKIKSVSILIFILVLALTGASCDGPAGPQGEQGPRGEQGLQGEQGPKGDEGTANVIYSEWMDIEWNEADETYYKSMIIEEPMISDFTDNGTILMYVSDELGTVALLLPSLDGNNFFSFIAANFPGTLVGFSFSVRSFDASTPVFDYGAIGFRVRYVLIPGGVPVAKMPDTFWKDYEAVAEYLRFDP